MHIEVKVKTGTNVSVDEVYDAMDAGERQHMANKLFKHGYVSPKANSKGIQEFVDGCRDEGTLRELIGTIMTRYPATLTNMILTKSICERG